MMPVMDGFEFVQRLREEEENRWIPIIVVTAKDLTEEDRRQLAGGVEHIIDKGAFTQGDMLQQIRDLVTQHSSTAKQRKSNAGRSENELLSS